MHKTRKWLILGAVLAVAIPVAGLAAYTQVSSTTWLQVGHYLGRSDGLFHDSTSKGLWVIENGTAAAPAGPTYYENFAKYGASKGINCMDFGDGSTCSGDLTTVPELLTFGDGLKLMAFPIATATINPVMTATGLDITGDLTVDEGYEVTGGVLGAAGRPFVIGTDPAFYFCATVKLADVDGSDEMMAGFRRAAPFTAAMQDYTDYAAVGNVSGKIETETEINGAGAIVTDTTDTWADAAVKKLCVYVSSAGAVTYKVNGTQPTTVVAMSFDSGDPVVPFVYLRHDANIAETTAISAWEVGYSQ